MHWSVDALASKLQEANEFYRRYGLGRLILEATDYSFLRSPITAAPLQRLYHEFAPALYRGLYRTDVHELPVPVDPFSVRFVDPRNVSTITGRPFPTRVRLRDELGSVRAGDWDRRRTPLKPSRETHPDSLLETEYYLHVPPSNRFEDSIFHQSMVAHFERGRPWKETEFVRKTLCVLEEEPYTWHGCRTEADVRDRCARIDELYATIDEEGYLSQRTLMFSTGEYAMSFLELLRNEVLVDVGRDGELLFVDGRHRLSIAKFLGLDAIPVVIVTRHREWVERVEAAEQPVVDDSASEPVL